MPAALRGLEPSVRANADWALKVAAHYGVPITVTSTLRTFNEQAELRRRYEQGLSEFPANRPGDSAHNYGLAWDSWTEERFRPWWIYVRRLAGFFVPDHDWIHAEVPNWRSYVR